MNVRVLVADEREANFFDAHNVASPLEMCGTMVNDAATLRDRDLESDRPGRGFNPAAPGRHGVYGERSTRRHEMEMFAKEIARAIDDARARNEFERLVIVAGPRMLGWLREALPAPTRAVVVAEVIKDIVHDDVEAIREVVPREAFLH